MNDLYFYITLIIELIIFIIIFNFNSYIIKRDGWIRHLPMIYAFPLYFFYIFIIPAWGYFNGVKTLFSADIYDYYWIGLLNITIGFSVFYSSYFYFIKKGMPFWHLNKNNIFIRLNFCRILIILGIISSILWGFFGEFGVKSLFLLQSSIASPDSIEEAFSGGYSYFIFFINLAIPGIIFSVYTTMTIKERLFWIVIFSIICLSIGFRYRLALLFTGMLIVYLINNGINRHTKKLFTIGITLLIIFMVGSTYFREDIRRTALGLETIEDITDDTVYKRIFNSSNNFLVQLSVQKYYNDSNVEYDYGKSVILESFKRAIPSSFFSKGDKGDVYSLDVIKNSFLDIEGYLSGQAALNFTEFYIAGGIFGIIFFSILFGFIFAILSNKCLKSSKKGVIATFVNLMIAISMFNFVTRGYIPGYLMATIPLILPFIISNNKNYLIIK